MQILKDIWNIYIPEDSFLSLFIITAMIALTAISCAKAVQLGEKDNHSETIEGYFIIQTLALIIGTLTFIFVLITKNINIDDITNQSKNINVTLVKKQSHITNHHTGYLSNKKIPIYYFKTNKGNLKIDASKVNTKVIDDNLKMHKNYKITIKAYKLADGKVRNYQISDLYTVDKPIKDQNKYINIQTLFK